MFLSVILLAGTIIFPVSAQDYGLKKGKSISLSIKKQSEKDNRTYFNLGLMSNYQNLNGTSINIISDVVHQKTAGFEASGFVNIVGNRSSGMQVAGLANISGIKSHGLRIAGLFNISGRSAYAAQISGIGNLAGINQKGIMLTGLINMSSVNAKGILISGMSNIAGNEQKGVAISGLTNVSGGNMYGAQISALSNVSMKNQGLQMSCLANYSGNNKGLQLGLANVSNKCNKGVQIGILNMNGDSCARQVGIINLKPQTKTQVIISGGNLNKANIAVRFKNKIIYTQLEAGMILGELTDKVSVTGIYRTGLAFPLVKNKLSLNTDIGYCHIETLANKNIPDRLYAIQPRLGLEYNPLKKLGLFIAGGYSCTRTYKNNQGYSRNPIVEAGLVFF